MQHLGAAAMVLPGTTPSICPATMKANPVRQPQDHVTVNSVDPCSQNCILSHENLASFRLRVRSDVMRTWQILDVTYTDDCYQVKMKAHGCGFKSTLSNSKLSFGAARKNFPIDETRI